MQINKDHNIYFMLIFSKLPKFVGRMFPAAAKKLDERAWNAFPYCKTELTVIMLHLD